MPLAAKAKELNALLEGLEPEQIMLLIANSGMSEEEMSALLFEWPLWAREDQLAPPGKWSIWLILAGRGYGKTRCGAEWVISRARANPNARIALLGETVADVRGTMVRGEAGILARSPPWFMPRYVPSDRTLVWPNGAIATTFSAERPDQLRGPAHTDAWVDELAKFRYEDAWDQLMFGLRVGRDPRVCVTTTPRPTKQIKTIRNDASTSVTTGSTYANRHNLAETFFSSVIKRYEGTRLGRQELLAELLDDVPGALWNLAMLDALRRNPIDVVHDQALLDRVGDVGALKAAMQRIVVAIDPAVTSGEKSDETGLVVCGEGDDGQGYVLEDASGKFAPNAWAAEAISLYRKWGADRVIGEVNNGGDLVENTIRGLDANIPFTAVHATRGKRVRAEPISQMYERKRIHHIGTFADLEDQMVQITVDFDNKKSGFSPDRMDALVWGFTFLFFGPNDRAVLDHYKGLVAAEAAKQVDAKVRIIMVAPQRMRNSTFYDVTGQKHDIGLDGIVSVPKASEKAMRKSGFSLQPVEIMADE